MATELGRNAQFGLISLPTKCHCCGTETTVKIVNTDLKKYVVDGKKLPIKLCGHCIKKSDPSIGSGGRWNGAPLPKGD